jgi:membrane protein
VAGLFYTTISLISQVEDSLNYIWRARRPRSFGQKFSDYLSVVLVGPVLVFTALALIASAQSYWLMQAILAIKPLGFFVLMVTRIMPLVLLCAVFTFVYRFIPHTPVRFSSALLGGVVAGVLWQLIGIAFAALVASSTQYEAIYSSFAVLILFLLWIHTGWLILLAGGEVAYLHQHRAVRLTGVSYSEPSHVLRERLGILMLVEITRRYLACEPPWRASALAIALGAPLYLLEELIDGLVQRGVLLRTTEPEGIALGCPPEQLSVSEIIELLGAPLTLETVDAGQDPVTRLLQRRDEAVRQATQGITLRSLAAETEGVS